MANELGDSSASGNVPETDSAIPGGGEGETGVTGELDFTDEVRVASHELLWGAPLLVLVLIALWIKSPLDEGLVTRSREEELFSLTVDLFFTDGEGGDPTTVTYSNATILI